MSLLENINSPKDLKHLSVEQLARLAEEISEFIIHSVSRTGGHLASNLGVVELTVAMHYVFDFASDFLLWDVGHQCYAHKILTGRKDRFEMLRKRDGLSGFPDPAESIYDRFVVGHAGTSIATAIGMALGSKAKKSDEKIVALVGDASIVNGVSFEALNNLGLVKRQMLIVLNDNSMAIDATQGAIAKFLSKVRLSHTYEDMRNTTNNILEHLPVIGKRMEGALNRFKKTLRMAISPSRLFESLNVPYFGPVDGHDIPSLIKLFEALAELDRPALLHVYTKKGKGFLPADDDPRKFHSTGPFEVNGETTGSAEKKPRTFTSAFGESLIDLALKDERIIAITAAMTDGTGLVKFREKFPERYFDVGIAESAAVDIAAGLARRGMKPIVCIYSTFLQRSFDQIAQEVSLADLPVVFCIDRGGLVGNDGPTHHGLLDIGFLRMLPNMIVIAPANETELNAALAFAVNCQGPVAIRYPKDTVTQPRLEPEVCKTPFKLATSVTVKEAGSGIVIVALGPLLDEVIKASEILANEGIDVGIIAARFAKPIDEKIISLLAEQKCIITVEDHSLTCGFGSAVLESAAKAGSIAGVINLGGPDEFIKAGKRGFQLDRIGISAEKIAQTVRIAQRSG